MRHDQPQGSLDGYELRYEDMQKKSNRGKPIKSLTNIHKRNTMKPVKKLKRKDDKMANDKQKNNSKLDVVKSVAWLLEASFRGFVGWVLLRNFDHVVTTAAAIYALGTAGAIVVTHFVKAHK